MAPDPDRQFTLKQAEIAVFNRNVWDLLWDFTVIADMAKVCDYLFTFISIYERLIVLTQQQHLPSDSARGAQALWVANEMVVVPARLPQLKLIPFIGECVLPR